MRIYLDTKDIIEIIEKSNPISLKDLEKILRKKNSELVISITLLLEISEPLIHKSKKTNVMSVINQIEMIPHIFIHVKNLIRFELLEAIDAFNNGREYKNVDPFRRRFTETLDLEKYFPLGKLIIYSLAEIIWNLFHEGALGGFDKHSNRWRKAFFNERNLPRKPTKKESFIYTIKKHLLLYNLKPPNQGIILFAKWIYKKSFRCPSIRLINEVFHKIVKNIGDIPKNSDLADFSHIQCLPYVDLMTVDRRFYAYVSQATKSLNINYQSKIRKSVKEILDFI